MNKRKLFFKKMNGVHAKKSIRSIEEIKRKVFQKNKVVRFFKIVCMIFVSFKKDFRINSIFYFQLIKRGCVNMRFLAVLLVFIVSIIMTDFAITQSKKGKVNPKTDFVVNKVQKEKSIQ